MRELDAEDAKLVTLARATRARTGAPEGAAVRDDTGRTYAAATVGLNSLRLSAVQAAVAAAVASGARAVEAGAVVTDGAVSSGDLEVLRELGPGAALVLAGPDGTVRDVLGAS